MIRNGQEFGGLGFVFNFWILLANAQILLSFSASNPTNVY